MRTETSPQKPGRVTPPLPDRTDLAAVLDGQPHPVIATGADGRFLYLNQAACLLLGRTSEELLGEPDALLGQAPSEPLGGAASAGQRMLLLCRADGSERAILWTLFHESADGPQPLRWESGEDITARRDSERALREAEHRANALFQSAPMGVHLYRLEPDGNLVLTAANPAADKILNREHEPLLGQPMENAFPEMASVEAMERFRRACTDGESWRVDQLDYSGGGVSGTYEVRSFQVQPGTCACLFVDLSERKRLERRLRHQALHDPLTGIANRSMCVERIDTALQRGKRRADYRHAVIFLDLDRFKVINDTLGHTVGDAVLVETGRRLRQAVRELDTVARVGGDEFVVLMEEFDSYKRPIQAIKRIRESLQSPIVIQGHEISITASIGLALGQQPAASAEETLRNANMAMQRAKAMGHGKIKSFTDSLLAQTLKVVRLENEMDRAIARGEFFLMYQPIIQVGASQRLFGFEALARWQHPERGLVMPGEFIPVAEDSGKVSELGYWALREGALALARWRQRHPHMRDAMLSVNISPQQIPRIDFLPRILEILQETGLPPANLKLEVTETALMQSGPSVLNKLEELRSLGVTFSVDDFGTGYSSLAYLTRLPLDHLKIDLSFVRMLEAGQGNLEIVRAIIQLAASLRMDVVAEGVETLAQQKILQGLGCEYFQGYLFSRPLAEDKAEEYLQRFAATTPVADLQNMP